jgi:acyl-CoA synthetase (AMP-forming)/AMP-acid ligase II
VTARTLNEMLTRTVERYGDKPALIFKGETTTFAELEEQIERCAAGLAELGIGKDDTFGIVMRNCPEFVILSFALSRLGAVAVPVNFLEKAERVAFIFNDAEVKGCLTSKDFLRTVREAQKSVPTLKHVFLRDSGGDVPALEEIYRHPLPETSGPEVGPEDLVLLIYTAGTTGLPKGVMLTQRNLIANVESCLLALDVSDKDSVLCVLPMFHSFAWTTNVILPIRLGAKTVVIESLLPFPPALKQIWNPSGLLGARPARARAEGLSAAPAQSGQAGHVRRRSAARRSAGEVREDLWYRAARRLRPDRDGASGDGEPALRQPQTRHRRPATPRRRCQDCRRRRAGAADARDR